MSVQMMGAVINCGPKDRTQKFVLLMMANYADDFGFAFPSLKTLAEDSCCDERTVRRQISDLEAAGWVYVVRKIMNGKSNVYLLNIEKIGVTAPAEGRRNPLFMRLLKRSPDIMTPIFGHRHEPLRAVAPPVEKPVEDAVEPPFLPEKSPDTNEFSADNPQPLHRTNPESHRTKKGGSPDKLCPPNRYNHQDSIHQGTTKGVEPSPPTPAGGGSLAPDVYASEGLDTYAGESPGAEDRKAKALARYQARWNRALTVLKLDLGNQAGHRNFTPIRPGVRDWDACFAFLGLAGAVMGESAVTLQLRLGDAAPGADEAATRAGLLKYAKRLTVLVREYFNIPEMWAVRFELAAMQDQEEHHAA